MAHKILLIDDDKINIALVKFGLAEKGYNVIVAYDGKEGLELFNQEKPDLIILDVMMPKMSGYEFMEELRSIQGFEIIPVLMLTANENLEDVFRLEKVKGYFVKPVVFLEIFNKIVECLGPNPD